MTAFDVIFITLVVVNLPLLLIAVTHLIIGSGYERVLSATTAATATTLLRRAERRERLLTLAVIAPLIGVSIAIVLIGIILAVL